MLAVLENEHQFQHVCLHCRDLHHSSQTFACPVSLSRLIVHGEGLAPHFGTLPSRLRRKLGWKAENGCASSGDDGQLVAIMRPGKRGILHGHGFL